MAKKSEKVMESMKRARANASRRARESRHGIVRRVSMGGTAYALGKGSDAFAALPTLFGMPRTATLAAVAAGVAMFSKGDVQAAAEGVMDASITLTAYQMGTGNVVAGLHAPYSGNAPIRDAVGARALEEAIEDELEGLDFEDVDEFVDA